MHMASKVLQSKYPVAKIVEKIQKCLILRVFNWPRVCTVEVPEFEVTDNGTMMCSLIRQQSPRISGGAAHAYHNLVGSRFRTK